MSWKQHLFMSSSCIVICKNGWLPPQWSARVSINDACVSRCLSNIAMHGIFHCFIVISFHCCNITDQWEHNLGYTIANSIVHTSIYGYMYCSVKQVVQHRQDKRWNFVWTSVTQNPIWNYYVAMYSRWWSKMELSIGMSYSQYCGN